MGGSGCGQHEGDDLAGGGAGVPFVAVLEGINASRKGGHVQDGRLGWVVKRSRPGGVGLDEKSDIEHLNHRVECPGGEAGCYGGTG